MAALLAIVSGGSLLVLLGMFFFSSQPPTNPLRLIRLATAFCFLPYASLIAIRWAFAGRVFVEDDSLIVEQRDTRIEIPARSIAAVRPWLLPLPGSGAVLELQSGNRFPYSLRTDDPGRLLELLTAVRPGIQATAGHPAIAFARARSTLLPRSAKRLLLKFPIFALLPTLPLFRVHQLIAYGGWLGEYYQYGLGPYLAGFAIYWASLTIYLLLYATALRVPVEIICCMATLASPAHAMVVRKRAEQLASVCFYLGVPVVLLLRFFPW